MARPHFGGESRVAGQGSSTSMCISAACSEEHPARAAHGAPTRRSHEPQGIEIAVPSPRAQGAVYRLPRSSQPRDIPERLIIFCAVDPRYPMVGEFIDRRSQPWLPRVRRARVRPAHRRSTVPHRLPEVRRAGLPLVIEIAGDLCYDEPDSGLECCLHAPRTSGGLAWPWVLSDQRG